MKLLLHSLFLLLTVSSVYAQDKKVYIDQFLVTDQVIHGTIDEKYLITMYLRFEELFEDGTSYSVSGWYYYDNVKKKIPLVGICADKFTLYYFTDQKRADSIRTLSTFSDTPWERLEELANWSGFAEKFDFSYEEYGYRGTWKNDKKELKVSFSLSDINLTGSNEFLVLQLGAQNKKHFDLKQIGPFYSGYSVFANKFDATGCKVLLKYELSSRSNPNGMCGAGMEIGYVLLTFDVKGNLLDYREEQIESCLGNIWSEVTETPNTNGKKLTYKVTHSEEKERIVVVDGVNFTLTSK